MEDPNKRHGSPISGWRSLYVVQFLILLIALSACGRAAPTASYRYKLTLSVDTPDGVKTAYSVVEVDYYNVSFPMSGEPHEVHGQGLYLDLGAGRQPLIVLLDRRRRLGDDVLKAGWNGDSPANIFANKCHLSWEDGQAALVRLFRTCKGQIPISGADLPDLVILNPATPDPAKSVNPNNTTIYLGPDVRWRAMTIEVTDEAVTRDIEEHMSLEPFKENIVHISELNTCCGSSPVIQDHSLARK